MRESGNRVSILGLVAIVMIAVLIQIMAPSTAEAATTKKTVTSNAYTKKVYQNGGLTGISASKRNNITKTLTRWEVCRILKNLYGNRINLNPDWISSTVVRQVWLTRVLSTISSQLGRKITWSGGSASSKVGLDTCCKLIVLTINTDTTKLRPKRWN